MTPATAIRKAANPDNRVVTGAAQILATLPVTRAAMAAVRKAIRAGVLAETAAAPVARVRALRVIPAPAIRRNIATRKSRNSGKITRSLLQHKRVYRSRHREQQLGTVAGKLQGLIKASLKVDMDYRKMLSLFKTSVISSRRRLTRMRPNRRSGFDAMGSRYELSTNLLIAVDVSGSVTDKSLQFFFSVINRLFKYGVEKLDVLQFDAQIQGEIEPLKKARKT